MNLFFKKAWAILKRDILESISYKALFVFDLVGILANLLTFYFITKLFGETASGYLKNYGGDYFSFVVIGLAFVGYQEAALNSFSGAIGKEQGLGTLEAIFVTPTNLRIVIFSGFLWDLLATTFRGFLYLGIGAWVFHIDLSAMNVFASIAVLLLTITSLAGLGIFSASFVLVFKRGDPVSNLVGRLSRFLSGVYFPITVLPLWLQKLSLVSPLTYALEGMRKALLRGVGIMDLANELGMLFLFTLILLPLGWLSFDWAIQKARKEGSLVFY